MLGNESHLGPEHCALVSDFKGARLAAANITQHPLRLFGYMQRLLMASKQVCAGKEHCLGTGVGTAISKRKHDDVANRHIGQYQRHNVRLLDMNGFSGSLGGRLGLDFK